MVSFCTVWSQGARLWAQSSPESFWRIFFQNWSHFVVGAPVLMLPLGKTCETFCDMMAVGNTRTAFLISSSLQSVPKDEGTSLRRVLGVMWAVKWPIADTNRNWSADVICHLPEIGSKVHHMAGNYIEGMVVCNEISFFSCTTHFVTTVYLRYVSLSCLWIVTNNILSCMCQNR